jgi:hypothetical protein
MSKLTDRERAENRLTKTGLVTINALVSEISELLQVDNAHITASTCTGDWNGSFDYSMTYDGGSIFLRNIGNHRPNSDITICIIACLKDLRDQYAKVFLNPARILSALIKRERADNARNIAEGFCTYQVKRVGIVTKGNNFTGWPYLILDVKGREQFYLEGILKCDVFGVDLDRLANVDEEREVCKDKYAYIYNGFGNNISEWSVPEGVTLISRDSYTR